MKGIFCNKRKKRLCFCTVSWGRNFDGHEDSGSGTTTTKATNVNDVGHDDFINGVSGSADWASVDADGSLREANWSKADGTSVCPANFRIPTSVEMQLEIDEFTSNDATGAFNTPLKLASSGYRNPSLGILRFEGSVGYVWVTTPRDVYADELVFDAIKAIITNGGRSNGMPLRCIKVEAG